MKVNNNGILAAALVVLGVGGYYGYRKGYFSNMFPNQKPIPGIADVKMRFLGFASNSDRDVTATIETINPSSFPLQVQSIVGDLSIDGRKVGTITMFGNMVIRPNNKDTIPVNVRVMPQLFYMWRKRGAFVNFEGKINVNNTTRPLKMSYTV